MSRIIPVVLGTYIEPAAYFDLRVRRERPCKPIFGFAEKWTNTIGVYVGFIRDYNLEENPLRQLLTSLPSGEPSKELQGPKSCLRSHEIKFCRSTFDANETLRNWFGRDLST